MLSMLMLLLLSPALAAGLNEDIELVSRSLLPHAPPGLLGVSTLEADALLLGGATGFIQNPLVIRDEDGERTVVALRQTLTPSAGMQLGERTYGQLSLPLIAQWGSGDPDFAADGVALGDAGFLVQLRPLSPGVTLTHALHADVKLPTGTAEAWSSAGAIRLEVGGTLQANVAEAAVSLEGAVSARAGQSSVDGLSEGRWLDLSLGAVRPVSAVLLSGSLLTKTSRQSVAVEALIGVTRPGPVAVDVAIGRGLTPAVGTSAMRLLVGLTWRGVDAPPEPTPIVTVTETPPPPALPDEPLAVMAGRQIHISDQLQFIRGSAALTPDSQPTIQAIAALLRDAPSVASVVVEGHASEEGTHADNFALSLGRASSVMVALVEAGVDQQRLSIRGMGEVAPVSQTDPTVNRRVVMIVGPSPSTGSSQQLPWTGEERPIDTQPQLDPTIFEDEE
ncbi:MAG: outer membrane protein OmpA-like peptidoglycan-associated protein [Myxococcota bacterium]|jgi:outer membrane protein OmpA-like peptidoglycan-associated protein